MNELDVVGIAVFQAAAWEPAGPVSMGEGATNRGRDGAGFAPYI